MAEYTAKDIGRRMVQLSIDNGIWISNLKLQKLLYFAWLDYFDKYGRHLFDDDNFQAWKYGPVVPSVYYEFWVHAGNIIMGTYPPSKDVDETTSKFLLDILKKYEKTGLGKIVEKSHESAPWAENYVEGRRVEIPYQQMEAEAKRFPI